jgi:hypothetical protein
MVPVVHASPNAFVYLHQTHGGAVGGQKISHFPLSHPKLPETAFLPSRGDDDQPIEFVVSFLDLTVIQSIIRGFLKKSLDTLNVCFKLFLREDPRFNVLERDRRLTPISLLLIKINTT